VALGAAERVRILFPYLARVRAANWSRYQQLLCARARAGDRVTVLQPPARDSEETNFQEVEVALPSGFTAEEIPLPAAFWNHSYPFDKIVKKGAYSIAANRRVRNILRDDPPDVLLVYNLTQGSLLSGSVPVVFDVADHLPAMLGVEGRLLGKAMEPVGRRVLAQMLERATLVTTPSRVLLGELPAGAVFLPNGVDPDEIRAARHGRDPRPEGGSLRIGFLGSFEYFIDFDLVLGLAALLPEASFLLIGGGRRHREVMKRVEHERLANVTITGPLAHPEALRLLASCDLSLCPFTRDEVGDAASPLKLFESLALAVPVLATRTKEITAENPGNLIYADSAGEARDSIAAWRRTPEAVRREIQERVSEQVLATRSWDRIGQQWIDEVRALLLNQR
jgi:glycosyltransferase involved in cell wall biosynthesis